MLTMRTLPESFSQQWYIDPNQASLSASNGLFAGYNPLHLALGKKGFGHICLYLVEEGANASKKEKKENLTNITTVDNFVSSHSS